MPVGLIIGIILGIVIVLILLYRAIKVLREYERAVMFRLGRFKATMGPGLIFMIPFIDRMVRVDLRTFTIDVPTQDVITRDNVPVKVNAIIYFMVIEPSKSVIKIERYITATSKIAQTTLRSTIGQVDLDNLLSARDKVNKMLQKIIDEQTEPWGIKVEKVEVRDVELPQTIQRAFARQAEAERERRAKIINAEGEFQASELLSKAAKVLQKYPASVQLRYFQSLKESSTEQNSTILFPVPIDLTTFNRRDQGKNNK